MHRRLAPRPPSPAPSPPPAPPAPPTAQIPWTRVAKDLEIIYERLVKSKKWTNWDRKTAIRKINEGLGPVWNLQTPEVQQRVIANLEARLSSGGGVRAFLYLA
ncbi:hypothetical protein JCM5296_002941 [Sporobolomyces johnsonii]